MNKETLIKFIFEKIPLIRALDGYKRQIGILLVYAAALFSGLATALTQLQVAFPEVGWISATLALVGIVTHWIGVLHASVKDE